MADHRSAASPGDAIDQLLAAAPVASRDAVASAWHAWITAARAAWPDVRFSDDLVAGFVAARVTGDDLATALAAAPLDLFLAAACADDEPTAHAAFDAVLTEVDAAGASTRAPRDLVDDVKQLLRVQLLVARDGKPPGITGYRGKGPLRGWVRITASRELIRHLRKRAREGPGAAPVAAPGATSGATPGATPGALDDALVDDPILAQLKAEYRTEFASALREAIAALSPEDRTLLRQHIADQLSIDAIGAAFGVHRATAARWLTRARAALVDATRARLAARLALPVAEIDSVIRLVQSQLDASVIRYLRDGDE